MVKINSNVSAAARKHCIVSVDARPSETNPPTQMHARPMIKRYMPVGVNISIPNRNSPILIQSQYSIGALCRTLNV
jgi:hypothetical protein